MKGKSLIIWIILLNVFDCSVCLTTVWLRKLILDPDTPVFCSPNALWKFRLRVRQPHKSGSCRDIWRKAEVKLCSGQTLTFDILLTTEKCSVISSSPMMLSLYLFERQSVGLEMKKRFIFRLPGNISLNTTRIINQMNETDGTSVLVGYENEPRKLMQADSSLTKKISQRDSTNILLPSQPELFEIVVRRSKRHTSDIFREENPRESAVLKRNSKLSLSESKSDLTRFELLRETTKLDKKLLPAALSNDIVKTNSTIDGISTSVSRHSLNDSNLDNSRLRTQDKNKKSKSRHLKSTENALSQKIDPYSSETLLSRKHTSSASTLSFPSVSKVNRMNLISSYTSMTPNSNWNTIARLPVAESSPQVTSLFNTKKNMSSYYTVNLIMRPLRTPTTNGFLIRTSGGPELFPLPTTDASTQIIRTTDLIPIVSQNLITDHETTKSKDIKSTLRTSKADTSIATTMFTDLESTVSSLVFKLETKTRSPEQHISPEKNHTSNEKNTDYRRSTIITIPSQTPTTTETTTTTTAATTKTTSSLSTTKTTTSSSTTTQIPTPVTTKTTTSSSTTTQIPTPVTTKTTTSSSTTQIPTPATTKTTTSSSTTQIPTPATTKTTSPSKTTQIPTTKTTSSSTATQIPTSATTETTTAPSTRKTTPATTKTTTSSSTTTQIPTPATTKTRITAAPSTRKTTPAITSSIATPHLLTSMTSKALTTTNRFARTTSEASTGSNRLSTTVTTSTVTDLSEKVTISNFTAPTDKSSNSTLGNETTTSLLHHTEKNVIREDDAYFWPIILSLVIGIPAIIVFTIAMVVIMKKRNIDSSTFFMSPPIGDEEV